MVPRLPIESHAMNFFLQKIVLTPDAAIFAEATCQMFKSGNQCKILHTDNMTPAAFDNVNETN